MGLEPLFLEMAATPEFKLGMIGKTEINASRFFNQQVAKGFTNAYANQEGKFGDSQNKAFVEGLKGAGVGATQALAFSLLGYGSSRLGKAVTEATKSGAAGIATNITANAYGFGGATLAEQVLSGQPIDEDKIRDSQFFGGR